MRLEPKIFDKVFAWMRYRRRNLYPHQLQKYHSRKEIGRCYWLEALGVKIKPWRTFGAAVVEVSRFPYLKGKVSGSSSIRISTRHVTLMRIFLSPHLVSRERQVRIAVNGRLRFKGRLRFNLEHLLEEVRRTGDRGRLFWEWIDVRF
jgi:hypothetical protein